MTGGAVEGAGGGVYLFGDFAANNSTITGNIVENSGANQGGGVVAAISAAETAGNTVTLVNSTVAGNSVTATGLGGGLAIDNPVGAISAVSVTVTNTIIAENAAGTMANDCSAVGVVTSDNNLSSDSSCQFADEGSLQGVADALLGSLQDNGGPTDTIALQEGSPAIDAGVATGCPAADQRAVTRPQRTACDIGAFEREPEPVVPVDPVDPDPIDPYAQNKADLTLKIKSKPKRPKEGKKLAFKVKVKNLGPATATGVVLKGVLPATTRKIKGQDSCKLKKSKARRGKTKFKCELGDLEAGSKAKLKVRAVAKGKLKAKAKVSSPVADPNKKNNKAKAAPKKPRVKQPG